LLNLFVRHEGEVMLLWEILSEQTVGVFIGAALPSCIGMCEIEFELEHFSDLLVIGKLFAMIRSQGMNLVCHRK